MESGVVLSGLANVTVTLGTAIECSFEIVTETYSRQTRGHQCRVSIGRRDEQLSENTKLEESRLIYASSLFTS